MESVTPDQALQNLHSIAENVALNGRDRDLARMSASVLGQIIKERNALIAEKEALKPAVKPEL